MSRELDNLAPRAATVFRLARELNFTLAGIAPAEPSEHAEHMKQWLAAGRHGEMNYLADAVEKYLDPRQVVPGARAVICVADRYVDEQEGAGESPRTPVRGSGRIARYAQGDDYHHVIKARLHRLADALAVKWPEHVFRAAVDTAPIMEREHAARAGLGWIGKHTLLIHPRLGSWLLLGEIITTLPLATSADLAWPELTAPPVDHCGGCTRCIDACPTRCITPHSVDASRCISYLTIEHAGPIDPALHGAMGEWIAGCDVCQQVCPFNDGSVGWAESAKPTDGPIDRASLPHAEQLKLLPSPDHAYAARMPSLPLRDVLNWTESARRQAVLRSSLKRIKLEQFKRNSLIAAGNYLVNHEDPALRRRIAELAEDGNESELVRITATQVMAKWKEPRTQ